MTITLDLGTLITVGTALSLAAGAALWAFRRLEELRRLSKLILRVEGNPESNDPKERDGVIGRVDDLEDAVDSQERFLRALARAMRLGPVSDERELAEAIEDALYGDARGSVQQVAGDASSSSGNFRPISLPKDGR